MPKHFDRLYEYEKYLADAHTSKETLDKYGVAIIPSVLTLDDTLEIKNQIWDTLEYLFSDLDTPLLRSDTSTWREFYNLLPLHSMLLQHFSIGHSQACWDVRQNPNVADVFAKLWNVAPTDLLTSFDGMSVHLPPEITNKGWMTTKNITLHTDQSYLRNDFECIQSWITMNDVNVGDATLQFLEGSHKLHKTFAETFGKSSKDDWYQLSDEEMSWYETKGCTRTSIKCKAGDMVLWDSRTIHAGQEAIFGREKPNERYVVYVCMQPRSFASPKMIDKKLNAFENMRMTSHWPCNVKLFSKNPRTYGRELKQFKQLPIPRLTELGMRLAGFQL